MNDLRMRIRNVPAATSACHAQARYVVASNRPRWNAS